MSESPTARGGPTLLLFPTELEHRRCTDLGGFDAPGIVERICGFGVAAAGARSAQLIAELAPRRVVLIGIAGAYDAEEHPVGEALVFSSVAIEGIGAGRGKELRGPASLGFPQWPGSSDTTLQPVHDSLELHHPPALDAGRLLTTCAASDAPEEASERAELFPSAVAEDMEGFSVAIACALARVPLAIVRGVSNVAGDREPTRWRIPLALAAARRTALEVIEHGTWVVAE